MAIIRGTTPTVIYTFSEITPSEVHKAYLTVKQLNTTIIERDISTAEVGETTLSWVLTQEETLSLSSSYDAVLCCDWKMNDGKRGRSVIKKEKVENSGKNEVI